MKYIVLALIVLACGCDHREQNQLAISRITYAVDSRTKLCFAAYGMVNNGTFTNVPCSPEVLAEIAKNPPVEN